jgi:uncharacterized membrane protein YccC
VTNEARPDHKDFWDRLQILLAPVGGLLTAIAVASLGMMGSRTVERQQSNEAKLRLYSELMTRREESEATLRLDLDLDTSRISGPDPHGGKRDVVNHHTPKHDQVQFPDVPDIGQGIGA